MSAQTINKPIKATFSCLTCCRGGSSSRRLVHPHTSRGGEKPRPPRRTSFSSHTIACPPVRASVNRFLAFPRGVARNIVVLMHHVEGLLAARSRLRQQGPRLAVSCARQRFPRKMPAVASLSLSRASFPGVYSLFKAVCGGSGVAMSSAIVARRRDELYACCLCV